MKCLNCGYEIPEGYICPNCGADAYIFHKARNVSIRLYNEALQKAANRDLSGAAANLEQSLLFDKNNIPARNLLGLILSETGRIADALKHWIISTSISNKNNPAAGYIDFLQKNGREMEKCNDAVRMYNQAIYYLKQGSDDLAIIQLKKALDNNPDFLDAYNLMTLCCIEDKNMKRAQHYNEIVLKRDTLNPLALHYAQLMGSTPVPPAVKKAEKNAAVSIKKTDSNPPIPRYKRKEKTTNSVLEKRDLLAFLLGIVATAVVMLVLVMPALNDSKDKSIKDLQAKVDHYAGETEMTPEEVLSMREELQKLQEENRLLRSEENKQANLELLQTAASQLSDEKYIDCVTTLAAIDTIGFGEEDLAMYNSIRSTVYPNAAYAYYTNGKGEFLSNHFAEAKVSLENAMEYINGENFVDDILYYLARIAEHDGDNETAKKYYEQIITDYPDSNQMSNVENALRLLNAGTDTPQN